jgi:hypothetical protein
VPFFLSSKKQTLAQLLALIIGELVKGLEVVLIVLHDGLVDDLVLYLRRSLAALEDEEDERLEEVLLLAEVLTILDVRDLERVHGDGMFLTVGDVSAFEIAAYTLVRVTRIDHHHVGVLLQELADDTVHVEALTASAWADAKEVCVVGHLHTAFLAVMSIQTGRP